MSEKLSPIERALVAASAMQPHDARRVLMLICESGMTMPVEQPNIPTEGQKHFAKREKFINKMRSSVQRICDYAKHETLRNIEQHFRDNPGEIKGADSDEEAKPSSLAERLAFERSRFSRELLSALREEGAAALTVAGQQLFDEIGRDDPWKMPGSDSTDFLDVRANLLSNVPDEVHSEIMQSIQDGLEHGETRKELMARIASKWDEIGKSRSETIANTETAAAFNFARDKAMREAGVTHKRWLHSQSPLIKEPRPTHLEADGQIVPIDEPFNIGGVEMMHPGDESAGPEEVINCHCVALPVEAPIESGDEVGHPFRGNQYTKIQTDLSKHFADMSPDEVKQAAEEFQSLRRERVRLINNPTHHANMREEHGIDYPYPNEHYETRFDEVKDRYSKLRYKIVREFGITGTKYDKFAAGEKYLDSYQVAERSFAPETSAAFHKRAIELRKKQSKP